MSLSQEIACLWGCRYKWTYEKVVFGILKDHIDGFVFQDDFAQCNQVSMMQLAVKLAISPHLIDQQL